jgi:hypothetical protein
MNFTRIIPKEKPKIEAKSFILRRERKMDFEDSIFSCSCNHPDYSHHLGEGECGYNCGCKSFISKEFEFEVYITTTDVFEFETPEHSEKDSLSYWNEFESWRRKNETNYNSCSE